MIGSTELQFDLSWTFCVAGRDDGLVRVKPLIDRARFADLIEGEPDVASFALIRRSELIGRPLGSAAFVAAVERSLGRVLASGKRGRKPRGEGVLGENIKGKTGVLPRSPRSRACHRDPQAIPSVTAIPNYRDNLISSARPEGGHR